MKFKIDTARFAEVLGDVQLPASKIGVAGTSLVLVEAAEGEVKFTTSDLDVTVTRIAKAAVDRPGICTVNSRRLLAISKSLPSNEAEIRTNPDKTKLGIFSGTAKATLPTVAVEEFPTQEPHAGGTEISIEEEQLNSCLSKVHYAASKDGTRYVCMGVCLETSGDVIKFVATDTKRVSISETSSLSVGSFKVVVPSRTIDRLLKVLPKGKNIVKITVFSNNIVFQWGAGRLESKLIEGEFPNYSPLLEQMGMRAQVVLNRAALLSAIRRAAGVGGGDGVVSLCLRAANLADKDTLGNSQGAIVVSLPDAVDGSYSEVVALDDAPAKESKVSFFSEYLIEPLSVGGGDKLVFFYGEGGDICFLQDSENLLSVIATVRESSQTTPDQKEIQSQPPR